MEPVFVAKRRFDPGTGERPETLIAVDWEYNVHADHQTSYFHSLEYLRRRVANEPRLNILGILRNPSADDLERAALPDFGQLRRLRGGVRGSGALGAWAPDRRRAGVPGPARAWSAE